ncbi:MAG: hypothetical protein ACI9KE_000247 [Polyangiales bacterium]|jgi:hypothetical protein
MAYMAVYGSVFLYVRYGDVDQVYGSMVLILMMGPLVLLAGGGGMRFNSERVTYRASSDIQLPSAGVTPGQKILRPNQLLTLGPQSIRQVYEENAMSRRNVPLRVQKGARLEVRDDDGEDDGVLNTAALWLVHPESNDEQLLLEHVTPDERDGVVAAVRNALRYMTTEA